MSTNKEKGTKHTQTKYKKGNLYSLNIINHFNSYLFTGKLNSPEANDKVSTSKKKKQQQNTYKQTQKSLFI
jgi:hypothetical protein